MTECGYYLGDQRKRDCFFYSEEHDMGATIPWCSIINKDQPLEKGDCFGCKYYCNHEVQRFLSMPIKEFGGLSLFQVLVLCIGKAYMEGYIKDKPT